MEAKAVTDLVADPVTVEVDGVTVALAIDDQGQPDLTVSRADKPLKSIPPAVKKHKKVAELTEREDRAETAVVASAAIAGAGDVPGRHLHRRRTKANWPGMPILSTLLSRLILISEGIMSRLSRRGGPCAPRSRRPARTGQAG